MIRLFQPQNLELPLVIEDPLRVQNSIQKGGGGLTGQAVKKCPVDIFRLEPGCRVDASVRPCAVRAERKKLIQWINLAGSQFVGGTVSCPESFQDGSFGSMPAPIISGPKERRKSNPKELAN